MSGWSDPSEVCIREGGNEQEKPESHFTSKGSLLRKCRTGRTKTTGKRSYKGGGAVGYEGEKGGDTETDGYRAKKILPLAILLVN